MTTALPRHPWNTDFAWPDHTGPFRRVTPNQARAYDELGYFVLESAVDARTVAALIAAIEPFDAEVMDFLAGRPDGRFSIAGVDTVSIALHPASRSTVCRETPALATASQAARAPARGSAWAESVVFVPRLRPSACRS